MKLRTISIIGLVLSACAVPALAHHSFAMFDHDKTVTVSGTVKEFEWTNPHVWLHVVATDEKGKTFTWSFEMGSVGQNSGVGWKSDSVKPGDKVTVGFHPLKDGSHGGQLLTTKLESGQTLGQSGRPGD
jgi:hypothetical protein